MVVVAQLVERWLVVPDVAGSSPVIHPLQIHGLPDGVRIGHPSADVDRARHPVDDDGLERPGQPDVVRDARLPHLLRLPEARGRAPHAARARRGPRGRGDRSARRDGAAHRGDARVRPLGDGGAARDPPPAPDARASSSCCAPCSPSTRSSCRSRATTRPSSGSSRSRTAMIRMRRPSSASTRAPAWSTPRPRRREPSRPRCSPAPATTAARSTSRDDDAERWLPVLTDLRLDRRRAARHPGGRRPGARRRARRGLPLARPAAGVPDRRDRGQLGDDASSSTPTEFEKIVVDELDELPDEMVDGLENLVFVVEDRPEDGSLDLLGDLRGRRPHRARPLRIRRTARPHRAVPRAAARDLRRPRRSCATRSTSPSCTRSRTSTASTTTSCTGSAGPSPRRSRRRATADARARRSARSCAAQSRQCGANSGSRSRARRRRSAAGTSTQIPKVASARFARLSAPHPSMTIGAVGSTGCHSAGALPTPSPSGASPDPDRAAPSRATAALPASSPSHPG